MYFDILNRLGMTHECDGQTDRRTDILIAKTALHYVARLKSVLIFSDANTVAC